MSAQALEEFSRGIDAAEAVVAPHPHGLQRDTLMMKLSEARALAEQFFTASFEPPTSGMMGRMS